MNVYFLYTCDPPLINAGTAAGVNDMMARSVVNPTWGATASHVLPNVNSVDVFLVLDFGNTADQNMFSVELESGDKSVANPWPVNNLGDQLTKDTARSAANPLTIFFGCDPCVEVHSTPITLTLKYGWAQTAQFTYFKDCLPEPGCSNGPSGGGHHGMTKAGVAALVIFLLGFTACVAGCGYNKFSQHKRGWAIVPGATSAAACFDQVTTGGRSARWTPQESDAASYGDSETGSISAAGAGYQSYSANL